MNSRERLTAVLNGKMPSDRLPAIETAIWWDQTLRRWEGEGMPRGQTLGQSFEYFGLDELYGVTDYNTPAALGRIKNEEDYERIKKDMYGDSEFEYHVSCIKNLKPRHDSGEISFSAGLFGFFWFPRSLFGIEPHFYAFYDFPELMHRINRDLLDFNMRLLTEIFKIDKPDFIVVSEDMSYNHGPMLSGEFFDEFILPYYLLLTKFTRERGVKTLLDSDGDVTAMIPWLEKAKIDGICPLERQAGVDIVKLREAYPGLIMLGGYDKMAMNKGEAAIRAEFERILPLMQSGRYIPGPDHQTPPGVSLADYKLYVKILKEYCEKAVK
ncbi:MAG: hypothetical protein FWD23_05635 [Oscillospiraceae bacterium]|nr:hypothetical protein [Oscillospiraceae bacterium]